MYDQRALVGQEGCGWAGAGESRQRRPHVQAALPYRCKDTKQSSDCQATVLLCQRAITRYALGAIKLRVHHYSLHPTVAGGATDAARAPQPASSTPNIRPPNTPTAAA